MRATTMDVQALIRSFAIFCPESFVRLGRHTTAVSTTYFLCALLLRENRFPRWSGE